MSPGWRPSRRHPVAKRRGEGMRRGSSDVCRRLAVALTAAIALTGLSGASHAQVEAPPLAPSDAPIVTTPAGPPPPTAAPPAEAPPSVVAAAPLPAAPRGESDFDVEQRRW